MKRQFNKGWIALFLIAICLLLVGIASADGMTSDGFRYKIKNNYAIITSYGGSGGDVIVPSTIREGTKTYDVTTIEKIELRTITSLSFPDSVTKIGHNAFQYNYGLRETLI